MGLGDDEKSIAAKAAKDLEAQLSGKSTSTISNNDSDKTEKVISKEYEDFKKENLPGTHSFYEKACKFSESIMKVSAEKKEVEALTNDIATCHLNVTPDSVTSLTLVGSVGLILGCLVLGAVFFIGMTAMGDQDEGMNVLMFFMIIGLSLAAMAYNQLKNMPKNMANKWRMQASNQMVICIFYIVTYMRHTSNIENAMRFAAEHVGFPLSLDLKRVIWNVETEEYSSMTESLDIYLEGWKQYAPEFVESMHLIESSLMQGQEEKRLQSLNNSLNNILEQTYEKMLHYAHSLQTPLSNLNMLGVILPVLGMVILPLVVSMMEVQWYYLMGIYNVVLFILVFNLGNNILNSRPTGYGDSEMGSKALDKFKRLDINLGITKISLTAGQAALSVVAICILLALSPFILHWVNPQIDDQIFYSINRMSSIFADLMQDTGTRFLDFRVNPTTGKESGPFGPGATLMSFFYTIAAGFGLGIYYKIRSSNVIQIRDKAKKLEEEFTTALFQLSNRLGDGYPPEIAIGKTAQTLEGSVSGEFFKKTSDNIESLGMSVEDAIFDKNTGAIQVFPSALIASTMKVLVESAKRGPKIASLAMDNVATYIKEIHKVDERLNDLMSETIQSMKSQIKMLTPLISAIVVGITSFIVNILGTISKRTTELSTDTGSSALQSMESLFGEGIPVYFFQIVVGLYVVQIVYILTTIINGVENGSDKLAEEYQLGQNLIKSTIIYIVVALGSVLGFSILGMVVLSGN